jgi:hypothetical protein
MSLSPFLIPPTADAPKTAGGLTAYAKSSKNKRERRAMRLAGTGKNGPETEA